MLKQTLKIDGMMCGMCEAHICEALRNSFQIKKVNASHSKGKAVILTEQEFPQEKIKCVIDKTGYIFESVVTESYDKKKFWGIGNRR